MYEKLENTQGEFNESIKIEVFTFTPEWQFSFDDLETLIEKDFHKAE